MLKNFLRQQRKKIYNRAKQLYCDATIFLIILNIWDYLSSLHKKAWVAKIELFLRFQYQCIRKEKNSLSTPPPFSLSFSFSLSLYLSLSLCS